MGPLRSLRPADLHALRDAGPGRIALPDVVEEFAEKRFSLRIAAILEKEMGEVRETCIPQYRIFGRSFT